MDDDVIRIPLRARDGSVRAWAIVDREDADLAGESWYLNTNGYTRRRMGPDRIGEYLHRVILSRIEGRMLKANEQCDHANGERMDNRRSNLRIVTYRQNSVNRRGYGESSYLGINRNKYKWEARISTVCSGGGGKRIFLGTFADEEEAARAYDRAARECHGEYARLNFPDGDA